MVVDSFPLLRPTHAILASPPVIKSKADAPPPPPAAASPKKSFRPSLTEIWGLASVLIFMALCDRFHVLGAIKEKGPLDLVIVGIIAFFGIVSIRRSTKPGILSVEQTTEMKGLLQVILLLYHYNGSSRAVTVLIFGIIRVDVALFIFLTGYGRAATTIQTKESFSFYRFFSLFVRLNLLCLLTAFATNRTVFDYYFIPLITVWSLILYLVNSLTVTMLSPWARCVFMAVLSVFLHFGCDFVVVGKIGPQFFIALCDRMKLDAYSAVQGMIVATAMPSIRPYFEKTLAGSWLKSVAVGGVALFALKTWGDYCLRLSSQAEYKNIHPFISVVPVVSFLVLRNLLPSCRSMVSGVFVWLGTISLELYLGQYHIWLAGGARKHLQFFDDWWVDFVVKSVVFLVACRIMQSTSSSLATYLLSDQDLKVGFKWMLIAAVIGIVFYLCSFGQVDQLNQICSLLGCEQRQTTTTSP